METRLPGKKLTIFLFAFTFAASAFAGELDLAIQATRGQQAQFTHRFLPKGFKKEQVEKGSVIFGVPPQMRWSYTKPESKVFVFDGRTSWFYTAAERQVTVTRLDPAQQQSVPFAFLWDPAAKKSWRATEKKRGNLVDLSLESTELNAQVKKLRLEVGARDHLIRKLEYFDRQGNRTVFELGGYKPFRGDAKATFTFTPPPGVQVIQN